MCVSDVCKWKIRVILEIDFSGTAISRLTTKGLASVASSGKSHGDATREGSVFPPLNHFRKYQGASEAD